MKRLSAIILILAVMAFSLSACATDSSKIPVKGDTRKVIAQKYVNAVFAEDFNELAKFKVTFQMRFTLLTRFEYKKVKSTFTDACGEFVSMIDSYESKQGDYWIVSVACEFEKTFADINIVFDENNRIAGIHYVYNRIYEGMGEDETLISFGSENPLPGALAVPMSDELIPAVIIVHGSGPSDRNGAVGGNAVYLDIARQLYGYGIASLRYDKRTYTYRNMPEGYYDNITVWEETINDVVEAFAFLKEQSGIDPERIYIVGHSLGGYLMPRIAKEIPEAAGFIMLAPSASHLEDLIIRQTEYINNLDGKVTALEEKSLEDIKIIRDRIKNLKPNSGYSSTELFFTPEAYWLDLADYNPVAEMKSEGRPILIIQGGRDYQVDKSEFDLWKNGLSEKENAEFVLFPNLNHMFAYGDEISSPDEYQKLSKVDPDVGKAVSVFIFSH